MKQETIEEADKRFNIFEKGVLKPNRFDFICGFRDGAKWQQERSYSEEEVFKILMDFFMEDRTPYKMNPVCVSNWFEQIKKK